MCNFTVFHNIYWVITVSLLVRTKDPPFTTMTKKPHDVTFINLDKIILNQYHYLRLLKYYSIILPTLKILLPTTFNPITYVILLLKLHLFLIHILMTRKRDLVFYTTLLIVYNILRLSLKMLL
jgi:hypothetical protein